MVTRGIKLFVDKLSEISKKLGNWADYPDFNLSDELRHLEQEQRRNSFLILFILLHISGLLYDGPILLHELLDLGLKCVAQLVNSICNLLL